jgi:RNA polymerase sigma-70 factor, ECF subfamily
VIWVGLLRNHTREINQSLDPGVSDAVLVARAKQGDAQAFALLYRRYLDRIYDFAAHRLESEEAAEDVAQAVFEQALVSLPKCRDGALFAGWLFAIARHVVADHHRARRYRTESMDAAPEIEDPAESPEDAAIRADQERAFRNARAQCLNDRERELLDLRLQDLNDKEISIALGTRHGAIRMRQKRMLEKLRECLGVVARVKGAARVDA